MKHKMAEVSYCVFKVIVFIQADFFPLSWSLADTIACLKQSYLSPRRCSAILCKNMQFTPYIQHKLF